MSKSLKTQSSDTIVLQIVSSGSFVKRALVRKNQSVQVLSNLFPDQPVIFIHRGEQLIEQNSFEYYQVQSGESIFVIPNDQETRPTSALQAQHWIRLSNDAEAINRLIDSVVNTKTRREVMRLRDVALLKQEIHRRRCLRSDLSFTVPQRNHIQPNRHPTVIVSPITELPSEALPVPW
jgi:hypothetical protein